MGTLYIAEIKELAYLNKSGHAPAAIYNKKKAQSVSTNNSTGTKNTTAPHGATRALRVYADEAMYIATGDSSITISDSSYDTYLPATTDAVIGVPIGDTHIIALDVA